MEIIVELVLEFYMELMMLIVPEKGMTPKKYRRVVAVIAIAALLGIFALVIWGLSLLIDKGSLLGIIPLSIAVILSLVQIVLGIVLYKKNHRI